jgi:hypothetical protein
MFLDDDADNGQYDWADFDPSISAVVALLEEIILSGDMEVARNCDTGFTMPVFCVPPYADDTWDGDPVIDRLFRELKYIGNCRFGLIWQPPGTKKAHVRVVGYSMDEAFRLSVDSITEAIYMNLYTPARPSEGISS